MSDRIIKGYWDCPYCGRKDIDGLVDECPGCGRHTPENIHYHLKNGFVPEPGKHYSKPLASETVTDEELQKTGISKEECDGNHKKWVCSYCNSLNNYADESCTSCGSPKSEASLEYGMKKRKTESAHAEENTEEKHHSELNHNDYSYEQQTFTKPEKSNILDNIKDFISHSGVAVLVVLVACVLFGILFWPHEEIITVNGFSWERNISIEEYRTVKESDWSVPSGGRVYDERTEIKTYVSVIDHYETVTELKTRQVIDHYETSYTYVDNGNGTFTEQSHQTPVYTTETYTETHQEPVYRQDPVYDTKYYYEIERWVDSGEDYPSSGNDKEPYWNEDYVLTDNERDTSRSEYYYVHFDNNLKSRKDYKDWMELEIGNQFKRTYNIIGITYKSDTVDEIEGE